jgi:ABC-type transporter lipoprotein component MlaA
LNAFHHHFSCCRYFRKLSIEQGSYVHTPFLGASFERNDTGMFAGFALTVVLIWLRYSLAHELSNLNLLFNTSMFEGVNFKRCYQLLAMQQV